MLHRYFKDYVLRTDTVEANQFVAIPARVAFVEFVYASKAVWGAALAAAVSLVTIFFIKIVAGLAVKAIGG